MSQTISDGKMSIKTIGFLYPGAMGASLAWRLHQRQPHLTLLTNLSSRSQATTKRSEAAGLQDVSLADVATRSDIIISILPPSAAITLAKEILAVLPRDKKPVYVDANAISPGTVSEIAKLLKERNLPFIDGSVIGGPAKEGYDPKIYLSTAKEYDGILEQVGEVLSGGAQGKGLKIEVMTGAGEGAASALKMAYGGIAKGTTGLAAIMVLCEYQFCPRIDILEGIKTLMLGLCVSRSRTLTGDCRCFAQGALAIPSWSTRGFLERFPRGHPQGLQGKPLFPNVFS